MNYVSALNIKSDDDNIIFLLVEYGWYNLYYLTSVMLRI